MKSLFLVCFVLFISLSFCGVIDLTDSTFDNFVDGSKPAFIEFYAPWCGHCKRLTPEYEAFGEAFGHASSSVVIGRVDCDSHKDLCSKYSIKGFPTLYWFPKGNLQNPETYNGGRTADDLIKFVTDKTGIRAKVASSISSVVILDDDSFEKVVLDSSKHVFVEFYAPWCGHCKSLAPNWEKLATAFANEKDVVVANIDADKYRAHSEKYGITGFPTIIFFPKNDKSGQRYSESRELNSLISFLNTQTNSFRNVDGSLSDQAGLVNELNTIVENFYQQSSKGEAVDAAKTFVAQNPSNSGKIYVRIFENVQTKGNNYVKSEIKRLEKMLSGSSISSEKRDEFKIRINILNYFAKQF
eukprot:TRINITY_DN2231_c1_g1_i1.p1 TRINITY_DN2231_c1_g1~~TRINITY_DN2231_c1_g1_i1.p1  ORF type:complete len:387 (-),score=157.36 TRINITY_DN2231_c1_g1_i1:100-1164(-)